MHKTFRSFTLKSLWFINIHIIKSFDISSQKNPPFSLGNGSYIGFEDIHLKNNGQV